MTLTPEERHRIYEEERARLEAQSLVRGAHPSRELRTGLFVVLGVIAILVILGRLGAHSTTSATNAPGASGPSTQPPPPRLALLAERVERTEGYVEVSGMVENLSSEPLEHVLAVAETYDSGGQFVSSEDALIEYDPLLPSQSSPFRVMVRYNPVMSTSRIKFKSFAGQLYECEDRTPPARKGS